MTGLSNTPGSGSGEEKISLKRHDRTRDFDLDSKVNAQAVAQAMSGVAEAMTRTMRQPESVLDVENAPTRQV